MPEKSTSMIETITLHDALNNEADYIRSIANKTPNATLNGINVDDLRSPGYYLLYTDITGANEYSYLLVLSVSYNITQINYPASCGYIKIRNYHNNSWTNWKNIAIQS